MVPVFALETGNCENEKTFGTNRGEKIGEILLSTFIKT